MIDDENHPEMQRAKNDLLVALATFRGCQVDNQTMVDLNNTIAEHRARWRIKGVDFPVLAALIVPRLHIISLVRADLDQKAIESRIVQFVKENPQVTARDVAQAVKWAFPDYRPQER